MGSAFAYKKSNIASEFDRLVDKVLNLRKNQVVFQRENTLNNRILQMRPSYTKITAKRQMRQKVGVYRNYLEGRSFFDFVFAHNFLLQPQRRNFASIRHPSHIDSSLLQLVYSKTLQLFPRNFIANTLSYAHQRIRHKRIFRMLAAANILSPSFIHNSVMR